MFGAALSRDAVLLGVARRILRRWLNHGWEGSLWAAVVCLWMMIPFSILWSISKERNDRILRSCSFTLEGLISKIASRIGKWALIRMEFFKFTFDDILSNWGACKGCYRRKERRSIPRSPPPYGVLKSKVDGASSGKPGPVGIG